MSLESLLNKEEHQLNFSLKKDRLMDRAFMFKKARDFFYQKKILEVDCPVLNSKASIDAHIDLISATYQNHQTYYLHSSPEYAMKRLLSEGIGDIYQLSHVFRDGELSEKHNPEFTMAEWYRLGFTLEEMINETCEFIQLFLGQIPFKSMTYRDLFLQFTGIDYLNSNENELFLFIKEKDISFYPSILEEGKDALLNLILGSYIEPHLGKNELFVLAYYPASQAALAKKQQIEDEIVAERFEIYYEGIELANGYHELTQAEEQRKRFNESNITRQFLGKKTLPVDEFFLNALNLGIPDCSGVAVGFDRLMMLRQKQKEIRNVLPLSWSEVS